MFKVTLTTDPASIAALMKRIQASVDAESGDSVETSETLKQSKSLTVEFPEMEKLAASRKTSIEQQGSRTRWTAEELREKTKQINLMMNS